MEIDANKLVKGAKYQIKCEFDNNVWIQRFYDLHNGFARFRDEKFTKKNKELTGCNIECHKFYPVK
jgi:hypothetical protein